MKVKVQVEAPMDELYLVETSLLDKLVVESDWIGHRDAKKLVNKYKPEWFYTLGGDKHFSPPVVKIQNGKLYFINGRHRFGVLREFMTVIPISCAGIFDSLNNEQTNLSRSTLKKLGNRISGAVDLEIPDLSHFE